MSSSSRENWAAEAANEASKAVSIGNLPVSLHAELAPTVLLGWPSWKTLGSRFGAAGGSGMSGYHCRARINWTRRCRKIGSRVGLAAATRRSGACRDKGW